MLSVNNNDKLVWVYLDHLKLLYKTSRNLTILEIEILNKLNNYFYATYIKLHIGSIN